MITEGLRAAGAGPSAGDHRHHPWTPQTGARPWAQASPRAGQWGQRHPHPRSSADGGEAWGHTCSRGGPWPQQRPRGWCVWGVGLLPRATGRSVHVAGPPLTIPRSGHDSASPLGCRKAPRHPPIVPGVRACLLRAPPSCWPSTPGLRGGQGASGKTFVEGCAQGSHTGGA